MSLSEIIAVVLTLFGAGAGLFIGHLWGKMRGEERGRTETLKEVERQQGRAYRETRERIDNAPVITDADRAAEFLRARQSRSTDE